MEVKQSTRVRLRRETFGGIAYVSHRDDFFALDERNFSVVERLPKEWTKICDSEIDTISTLAKVGLCSTRNHEVEEIAYSGPSFIGDFDDIPGPLSQPLVLNCFVTSHCPLQCHYCYADDLMQGYRADENDDQIQDVLAVAERVNSMVAVVTGGDPLTRPDRASVFIPALYNQGKCLVLDTSGVGEISPLIGILKDFNVHVRVSIDTVDPKLNMKSRAVNKAYVTDGKTSLEYAEKTLDICIANDIPVTVQTVVGRLNDNPDELNGLARWLIGKGVRNWVLHLMVDAGAAHTAIQKARLKRLPTILYRSGIESSILPRLVRRAEKERWPLDIRFTDTSVNKNAVLLLGSRGDLYTQGVHSKADKIPLMRSLTDTNAHPASWGWGTKVDTRQHLQRYVNCAPWLFRGKSFAEGCYQVP